MKKINIAIDGPSGSGKGTTAKELAKKLHYNCLDTGAMYRAIGLYMKQNKIESKEFKSEILEKITVSFNSKNEVELNGKCVEHLIRNEEIAHYASLFCQLKEVRVFLVKQQQEIVKNLGYVVDGRDAGTVIIPNSPLKVYLTSDVEIRAERRLKQLKEKGILENYEDIVKSIKERDFEDRTRVESPLIKAKDSIEIDNSFLTIEEQVDFIYNLAQKIIKN